MITNERQFILDSLRTALLGKADRLTVWRTAEALDTKTIVRIIQQNGILLTVFPVLAEFPEIQNALHNLYYCELAHAISQDHEGKQILHALNDTGLNCIALKGWKLRRLYPNINMRQMADLDILVRPYDFRVIKETMLSLGYSAGNVESSWKHDNFSKGTVKVEMHKRLTDDSGPIRDWEHRMWQHALPSGEGAHILRMSVEDFFIFHIVHMYKDFLNGSLGLRRIADTWLLTHAHPDMDRAHLAEAFDRMGLSLFAERMIALGKATMGETELDENSEIMLAHAFEHGIYGSDKSYKAGRITAMGSSLKMGKIRSALTAVFLPVGRMKAQYPVLEKYPILLPYYWLRRIKRFLGGNRYKYRRMLDYSNINDADFAEMKHFLEVGGA